MKISVILRTRNEEKNIERFCSSYDWADHILIADGDSTDKTIEIAKKFPNVAVREFLEKVSKNDKKVWRNPHGKHINFMIKWAEMVESDWIIFDDADCFPNLQLKKDCRSLLENTEYDFACVNRIYMYGETHYFRNLTLPGMTWENSTSLYAWKSNKGCYSDEEDPWIHGFIKPIPNIRLDICPPYCVLHDYYPTDGSRLRKVEFYRESGEQETCADPLFTDDTLHEILDWMK